MTTIAGALAWATGRLLPRFGEDAEREGSFLLAGVLQCAWTELWLKRDEGLAAAVMDRYAALIDRRRESEPAAYLLGAQNFRGRDFAVNRDVLIPRPETELLVDEAIRWAGGRPGLAVLDVGSGSGCVAVSLALEMNAPRVTAVDVSSDALSVSRTNAARHRVEGRIDFILSDVYEGVPAGARGDFDMIASNPPYVTTDERAGLDRDLSFEPALALDGGADGLAVIDRLIAGAPVFLRKGGVILIEIGYRQGAAVRERLYAAGFRGVSVLKDFAGHDRIAKGEWFGSI